MKLNCVAKSVIYFGFSLMFAIMPLSSTASELNNLNKGVVIGKYINTDLNKSSPGMTKVMHLCQYIKSDGKFSLNDITNGRVEIEGPLTEQYFVVSTFIRAEDADLFSSSNQDAFCAADAEHQKPGSFKGRSVVYVTGSMSLSDSMKIRIMSDSMQNKPTANVKEKMLNTAESTSNTTIFKCKDKHGKLKFQDSPCD